VAVTDHCGGPGKGKGSLICIVLYYELLISKALNCGTC